MGNFLINFIGINETLMKILLVDAYSTTENLSTKFLEFKKILQSVFYRVVVCFYDYIQKVLDEQKELVDKEDVKIFERTLVNLDDFLFEMDSSFVQRSAAKLFDHVDMILIDGDTSLLPWSSYAHKVT